MFLQEGDTMRDRLIHDTAWATATKLLESFGARIPEGERKTAFGELYTTIKAGIEAYAIFAEREHRRLRPGKN
jgi:hypothetical protein